MSSSGQGIDFGGWSTWVSEPMSSLEGARFLHVPIFHDVQAGLNGDRRSWMEWTDWDRWIFVDRSSSSPTRQFYQLFPFRAVAGGHVRPICKAQFWDILSTLLQSLRA